MFNVGEKVRNRYPISNAGPTICRGEELTVERVVNQRGQEPRVACRTVAGRVVWQDASALVTSLKCRECLTDVACRDGLCLDCLGR
jgi:hypothetical protein